MRTTTALRRTTPELLVISAEELRAIADAMDVPDWAQAELTRVAWVLRELAKREEGHGPKNET